jgi:hypothetical protein
VTEHDSKLLRAAADEQGVPLSFLIRRLIRRFLQQQSEPSPRTVVRAPDGR